MGVEVGAPENEDVFNRLHEDCQTPTKHHGQKIEDGHYEKKDRKKSENDSINHNSKDLNGLVNSEALEEKVVDEVNSEDEVKNSENGTSPENNHRVKTGEEEHIRPSIKQVLVWRPSFTNPFVKTNHSHNNKHTGVESLNDVYPELKKVSEDFDKFGRSVNQDITEKIKSLQDFKDLETSNRSDRNYANVQIFMLRKYMRRIDRFKDRIQQSEGSIQESLSEQLADQTAALVDQHLELVGRMKTRLKHILDVSEKYAAIDPAANATDDVDGEGWTSPRLLSRSMEQLNPGEKSMSTSSLPFPSSTLPSTPSSNLPSPSSPYPLPSSGLRSPLNSNVLVTEMNGNVTTPNQDPNSNHRKATIANLFRVRTPFTGPPSIQIDSPPVLPSLTVETVTGRLSLTPTPPSSPDSGLQLNLGDGPTDGMRKRASSFQSITEHLTVLRKTYSNKR